MNSTQGDALIGDVPSDELTVADTSLQYLLNLAGFDDG